MKVQRLALVVAVTVMCAIPAKAEELRATEARQFIAGKHFSYSCFDGTNGNGRIYADGSVAGYVQPGGSGPRRYVVLADRHLANQRRPILRFGSRPSVRTLLQCRSHQPGSFRGSISGLGFAYCNFTRRGSRGDLQAAPTYRLRGVRASAGED